MVNLTEVKQWLKIDSDDTSLDTFLTSCILYATEIIENYAKQNITLKTHTKVFYGNDNFIPDRFLMLRHFPVQQLVSVRYKDKLSSNWMNVDLENFFLFNTNKICYIDSIIPWNPLYYYEITYTSGYQTIPNDLKQITLEMVDIIYNDSVQGKSKLDIVSVTNALSNHTYTTTSAKPFLTDKWLKIIKKYKYYTSWI